MKLDCVIAYIEISLLHFDPLNMGSNKESDINAHKSIILQLNMCLDGMRWKALSLIVS